MTVQQDIEILLGVDEKPHQLQEGVVPIYLEQRYDRLGAVENIRDSGGLDPNALAALIRVLVVDDEEEVREAALSALCEMCDDDTLKRTALVLASVDQNERVLTTVLEQANDLDLTFAKSIASRLVNFPDPVVSDYAEGILKK